MQSQMRVFHKNKLYPEWSTLSSLFLVWPEGLSGRGYLAGFYLDLLASIPKGTNVTIIIKDRSYRDKLYSRIKAINPNLTVEFLEIPSVRDIWIKDWAPLIAQDEKGRKIAVKAVYRPKYLVPHNIEDAEAGNAAGEALVAYLGLPLQRMNLVWDIGNFTHNGRGIGIVTNRLVADNENVSVEEIRSLFLEMLGISQLLFVPVEPGDETGHVDGMIRFFTPLGIAVAAYPEQYRTGHMFMNALCDNLRQQLGRRFYFVRLRNAVPEKVKREGIMSALGNSVNFLRLGKTVLVPDYGRGLPDGASALSRPYVPVRVRSKHLPDLARLGGALNCISWVYYS